jgi:WD40 repeat protein
MPDTPMNTAATVDHDFEVVVEQFLREREAGSDPDRQRYLESFPQFAPLLRDFFAGQDLFDRLAPDLAPQARVTPSTAGLALLPPPGERVGDFELLEELGRGGMGVVYRARQQMPQREVALKLLRADRLEVLPQDEHARWLERFRREAQLVAAMDRHPHLITLFEVGEHNGQPFFTMELVRGGSLAHRLRQPRQSQRELVAMLVKVARAVDHAHRRGVLHRDLKPGNILLDENGEPRVGDFGLARRLDQSASQAPSGVAGTVPYMAPEQARGDCGATTTAADVYSLGAILYELLTGRPPFVGSNDLETLLMILEREAQPPSRHASGIGRDLETICLKCLRKEPQARYASAAALADDLDNWLAGRPVLARPVTTAERGWRWCRRNPVVAALSAALLLLLTVTAVAGVLLSLRLNTALEQAQDAVREGQRKLFDSRVAQARAQRLSGRVGQRFAALESIRHAAALARELDMPESTFDELRDLAIAALTRPDVRLVTEWDEPTKLGPRGAVFDTRGEQYARLDRQGKLTVRRLSDHVEIARLLDLGSNFFISHFDEDGRGLVLVDIGRKSRMRWRFDTSTAVPIENLPDIWCAEDRWRLQTADGKLLVAVNRKTGLLAVHEPMSGKHLRDIPFGKFGRGAGVTPAFLVWDMHPWRHELAICMGPYNDSERHIVHILDLDRGTATELVADPPQRVASASGVSWHPDGRTLAVGYTNRVLLWDVPTRTAVHDISEHKGGDLGVRVNRSGQLLATHSGWASGLKFWHPHTRKLLLSMPSAQFNLGNALALPNGRIITQHFVDGRVQLWVAEPSPILRLLVRNPVRGPLNEYRRGAVHKGGRLLAVGTSQGVSLFDLASGLDVGHLDLGFNQIAQFDPATGDLLTFGKPGLIRWPVHVEKGNPIGVKIGPPKRLLATRAADNEFRISKDGRTIAVAEFSRVLVLHADRPDKPVILAPTVDVRQEISISPDGQWVATGSHGGGDVLVWDARTGQLVKRQRVIKGACDVLFTPDGKRLLAGTEELSRFWSVGDWNEQEPAFKKLGPPYSMPSFSPDGQLLVWESGEGALRLLDTKTGRQLARLESPDEGRGRYTTFSPEGRFLIVGNLDFQILHVWDLHELRRQLQALDLDWNPRPDPPLGPGAGGALLPRLEVEVDIGRLKDW